ERLGEKSRDGAITAFVTEALEQRSESFIIRGDDTAVTAGNVLGGLEREASNVANGADGLSLIQRAPSLRTVLNQNDLVFVGEGLEAVKLGGVAAEMDRNDGFGFGSNQRLGGPHADLIGPRFQVGKDG